MIKSLHLIPLPLPRASSCGRNSFVIAESSAGETDRGWMGEHWGFGLVRALVAVFICITVCWFFGHPYEDVSSEG
jgi:hypothetical protein